LSLNPQEILDGKWPLSDTSGIYLTNSSQLGIKAKIIYAHNWPSLLVKLPQIQEEEQITLIFNNDKTNLYKVKTISRVKNWQKNLLFDAQENQLIIYTCIGWLDQDRIIVIADQIS